MGQSITVESNKIDNICVFTTDRSISGQDGAAFDSTTAAETEGGFPGTLAMRLFSLDEGIDHVYVASNDVIIRRSAPWDAGTVDAAATTIGELFRFYPSPSPGGSSGGT